MAKKGLLAAGEGSRTASLLFEQAQSVFCCGTEDQKEAVSAAMEGRAPIFQGK
jgi:enoyl-CoA hydratase